MIVPINPAAVSGSRTSGSIIRYGIRAENVVVVQKMLSEDLYSNPLRASLQEYASNSLDAHVENGNPEVPIEIYYPTQDLPELIIEDHGIGINKWRMENVVASLAASTKRGNNEQLGGWGLGSKTGFALTDTFFMETVAVEEDGTKWHRIWCHFKDEGMNSCVEISGEVVPANTPTGTKIRLPIEDGVSKVAQMHLYVQEIAKYWPVKPIIHNHSEPVTWEEELSRFEGDGWRLLRSAKHSGVITAVIGNIPYKLDHMALVRIGISHSGDHALVMFFKTGEVAVLPTRENIDYDKAAPQLIARYGLYQEQAAAQLETVGVGQMNFSEYIQLAANMGIQETKWMGRTIAPSDLIASRIIDCKGVTIWSIRSDFKGNLRREKTSYISPDRPLFYSVRTAFPTAMAKVLISREEFVYEGLQLVIIKNPAAQEQLLITYPGLDLQMTDLKTLKVKVKIQPSTAQLVDIVYWSTGEFRTRQMHKQSGVIDLTKVKGRFAYYYKNRTVDIDKKRLTLDLREGEKVILFQWTRWHKGLRQNLLQATHKLKPYASFATLKLQRAKLKALWACRSDQRKQRLLVIFDKGEKYRWRLILSLPAFSRLKDRFWKLATSQWEGCTPDKFHSWTPNPCSLIRRVYPNFINPSNCHSISEWKELTQVLRYMKPKSRLTWADIKLS